MWKPAQVAGLIDSLYRRYPSGSILLWETTETVTNREMATDTGDAPVFVTKPLYLLDRGRRRPVRADHPLQTLSAWVGLLDSRR